MILFIDNYDSFTYNLVHLVGRITPNLKVVRNDELTVAEIRDIAPSGILLSPGPGRPEEAGVMPELIRTMGEHTPMLGVCLGHQAIGQAYGGTVTYAKTLMHGKISPVLHQNRGVFEEVPNPLNATRYHSLVVDRETLPDCFEVTAWVEDGTIMGIRHRSHPIEGVQFHPESVITLQSGGGKIIENWVASVLQAA